MLCNKINYIRQHHHFLFIHKATRFDPLTPADDNLLEPHTPTGYPSDNRNCFNC